MTSMIEATSQFEIPRPTLRSSLHGSGTGPPGTVLSPVMSILPAAKHRPVIAIELTANAQADARGRSDRTTTLSNEKNWGAKGIHR